MEDALNTAHGRKLGLSVDHGVVRCSDGTSALSCQYTLEPGSCDVSGVATAPAGVSTS